MSTTTLIDDPAFEAAVHAEVAKRLGLEVGSPPTVRLAARDLYRILESVLPHVSDDDTLPVLQCVRMEAAGGILLATATDRYTLGQARADATGTLGRAVHLPADELLGVTAALKTVLDRDVEGAAAIVALELADDGHPGVRVVVRVDSLSIGIRDREVDWPDLAKVYDAAATFESSRLDGPAVVDPLLLARFAVVQRFGSFAGSYSSRFKGVRLSFSGPVAPVRVEFGDWFAGAIMPMRTFGPDIDPSAPPAPTVPFGLPAGLVTEAAVRTEEVSA